MSDSLWWVDLELFRYKSGTYTRVAQLDHVAVLSGIYSYSLFLSPQFPKIERIHSSNLAIYKYRPLQVDPLNIDKE